MPTTFPPIFVPNTSLVIGLTAILGGSNPFDNLTVHLFQGSVLFTNASTLADLLEADFDGYAESPGIVWSTPFLDGAQQTVIVGQNALFPCTGNTTPNIIGGWYLTDSGDSLLAYGKSFDTPIPVFAAGQLVAVQPYFIWAQTPEGT